MRRNHLFKAIAWLWAIAAVSSAFLSGTLAKYIAGGTVAASAGIATFDPVWTCTEGPGDRDSGIVVHPHNGRTGTEAVAANWTTTHSIIWTCTNNSEVAVTASMGPPQHAVGPEVNTTAQIGHYINPNLHTYNGVTHQGSRAELTSNCIKSNSVYGGAANREGLVNPTTPSAPVLLVPGDSQDFTYTIQGYTAAPDRGYPYNAADDMFTYRTGVNGLQSGGTNFPVASTGRPAFLTFTKLTDTGNTTLNVATSNTWWRTYRVNSDGSVVQVD